MNYLEQVVTHGAARLAVCEVALEVDLFTELKSPINVFR
jgi:hypothetical protein